MYQFLDENDTVLYVGKAKNLKNRVSSYFIQKDLGEKTKILVSQIKKIKVTVVEFELESLLLEASFIKKFEPKYNVNLKDGKSYPLIKITIRNTYPAILLSRKADDPQSIYFGPYPNAGAVKMVLRTLRRIFPYSSQINHPKKICLYNHLHLCPCPPVLNAEHQKEYKKTLRYIIKLLDGKKTSVVKSLQKERDNESKKLNYEQAQKTQKQIDALTYVTGSVHEPFEYETNPNLRSDLRTYELNSLKSLLNQAGLGVQPLKRIECFDISNLATTNAVGSMVVFVDGEKESSQYRRFKIKRVKGQNDFAMMKEVISRRIKHFEDWGIPDLIIVDGGKGQISSAEQALKEKDVNIPLVGLTKREEIIITSDFKEIKLPKSAKALQLVMRIRDEAHRFAITYQRLLRSKSTFFQ